MWKELFAVIMPSNPDDSETGSEYDEEEQIKTSRKRGKAARNSVCLNFLFQ